MRIRPLQLHNVDRRHQASERSSLYRHTAHHGPFADLSFSITELQRALGENARDETFWAPLFREWKRFRYLASVLPLPFNSPILWSDEAKNLCSRKLKVVHQVASSSEAETAEKIDQALNELRQSDDSPLRDLLANCLSEQGPGESAILLQDSRHLKEVGSSLLEVVGTSTTPVLSPAQLKDSNNFDRLYLFGPSKWYQLPLLAAPRADELHVLQYNWLHDTNKTTPVFDGTKETGFKGKQFQLVRGVRHSVRVLEDDEMRPSHDWHTILRAAARKSEDDFDDVEAKLYLLEDCHGVFYEDDSRVLALDIEVGDLERIAVQELERGMYLALRTEGGGDYMVELADLILEEVYPQARELQKVWKIGLRDIIRRRGLTAVGQALTKRGAIRSSPQNVRNWVSSKTIRPDSDNDFKAILFYTGLRDEAQKYLDAARAIDSAHRRAARRIRRRLISEVHKADFSQLELKGRLDFELPGSEGGKLTLFRIRDVSPEAVSVASWQVGKPFRLEE
jgi:hypothetical protein